ncbi:MAG: hypothetical protein L0G69_10275 [Brevibacterium sp.]|nr:hypothetical protein [Brevibacterium sp.]
MDLARVKNSSPTQLISAEELKQWEEAVVKATSFLCPGCDVPVIPRSYLPGRQTAAHFYTKPAGPDSSGRHESCALFDDVEGGGISLQPGTPQIRHAIWPNRLVAAPERKTVDATAAEGLTPAYDQRKSTRSSNSGEAGGRPTTGTASHIRPFAIAYRDMTLGERRQVPIDLPGIDDADVYQYAFRQLPKEIKDLKHTRVFHGPLRWKGEVTDLGNGHRQIELFRGGDYDAEQKRYTTPWVIIVDASDWDQRSWDLLLDEIESACAAIAEREIDGPPSVYVLGTQDRERLTEIHVSDPRFIAVIVEE